MRGKYVLSILLPLALAAVVGACATNGVPPGFVQTANSVTPPPGSSGRVVSINDVSLQGSGGTGSGRGPLIGGLLGGAGGAAIGAGTSGTLAGGLIGGVLGAVGGAIAGKVADSHGGMGGGRGIQVTVQSDDGQTAVVAQRDDGDIQLGDRVQIIEGPGGVPKVVRENPRAPDFRQNGASPYAGGQYGGSQYGGAPQDYRQSRNYGTPPQDYGTPPGHGPVSRDYAPLPPDYGQSSSYPPPQDYRQPQGSYYSPQDDPRYGSLN
jgi:outer membrane lipoprotein SlyB